MDRHSLAWMDQHRWLDFKYDIDCHCHAKVLLYSKNSDVNSFTDMFNRYRIISRLIVMDKKITEKDKFDLDCTLRFAYRFMRKYRQRGEFYFESFHSCSRFKLVIEEICAIAYRL